MAKITVDGIVYEVNPQNNLLQECLSHGLDLPYFCWHPCMGSVGACRQCAVKQYRNADDKTGVVVMSCMTPASDGAIISIADAQAVKMRSNVIESLMISHPHDCPVCEEGGECHLQDMTQMSGHNYRRYDFKKVTHRNQNLGPFINHEMNRCIACYRCVRYYDDYAGGKDLAALGSHHHVYFGRHEEGTLENEFSGNLVEVCPTGVFTDKTFSEHYTRKWDLQTAPSVCTGCGAGCNTTPGERYGTLRRIVNRYHHDLNGYFLCDRGRFGYGYNSSDRRITEASLVSTHDDEKGVRKSLTTQEAQRQFDAMTAGDVVGIGSPRTSLENNLALRARVGVKNFYAGFSAEQQRCVQAVIAINREQGLHCPDIRTLEQADCVLVVNEDITNTSPRFALALRQAVRNRASQLATDARIPLWQDAAVRELAQNELSPLFILSPQGTRLDDVATDTFLGTTAQQIALLAAVANIIDASVGNAATDTHGEEGARRIASALITARHPCIVSGISAGSEALIHATANVARALRKYSVQSDAIDVCFAMPESNTMGLALLMEEGGGTLDDALQRLARGEADAAIVLENDLTLRTTPEAIDAALSRTPAVVVIDQLHNEFNARAQLLLPSTSFAEQNGTLVNYEGRAQSSHQVFQADAALRPGYEWLTPVDPLSLVLTTSETILYHSAQTLSVLSGAEKLLPPRTGIQALMKSPRQSHRYSGRTAMNANLNVHEKKQPADRESAMSFSMEGLPLQKDASLLSAAWAPAWNSNQAISKFQDEINGELKQGCKGVHLLQRTLEPHVAARVSSSADNSVVYFIDHIFGSEELSAASPAITARSVGAYLCVGEADAQRLGLQQHGRAEISSGAHTAQLPVLIRQRIAPGAIGIYCGGEINRHAFANGVSISAVAEDSNVLVRSRQMFSELVISDSQQGRG
ncbi:MAG: NADH-quinone oxidoreductase subunit NuoG [Gammaproteobacteria bacterium]|nr:NADH-quinone oxidoreductase subunit NuoG [Gammaproteobacteria bacterium]MDP2140311.1 NADH-quinone oxidoreductase subunit NuoG [Gammaproteobacteria bacterium]MDP2346171.1 NADH-quinone oxidoreductase subunit NuoG [Gammaproteobacteria bacterium]